MTTHQPYIGLSFTTRYDDTGAGAATPAAQPSLGALLSGLVTPVAPSSASATPAAVATGTESTTASSNGTQSAGTQPNPATPTVPTATPEAPAPDYAAAVGMQVPETAAAPTAEQTLVTDALSQIVEQQTQQTNIALDPAPFVNALRDVSFVTEEQTQALQTFFGEDNAPAAADFFNGMLRSAMQDMVTFQLALTQRHGEHMIGQQQQQTQANTLRTHVSDALGDTATPAQVNAALAMASQISATLGDKATLKQIADGAAAMLRSTAPQAAAPAPQPFGSAGQPTLADVTSAFINR